MNRVGSLDQYLRTLLVASGRMGRELEVRIGKLVLRGRLRLSLFVIFGTLIFLFIFKTLCRLSAFPPPTPLQSTIANVKFLLMCRYFSGGCSHLPLLVSAEVAAVTRPLLSLRVLEMGALPLEVHRSFRCQHSVLLLLAVIHRNPPQLQASRHPRHRHLCLHTIIIRCNNPATIVWFGLLALCRRQLLSETLNLQPFKFLQVQQVNSL
jgi:hypothetical protein